MNILAIMSASESRTWMIVSYFSRVRMYNCVIAVGCIKTRLVLQINQCTFDEGPPLSILVAIIRNHTESWLDSGFDSSDSLLILVYQKRIYLSRDNILRKCTNIYSGSLIPDSRIT